MPNKKYAKRLMWPESQKAGRAAVHCHRAINVDRCVHCQRGSGAWWKDPGRILTPSRRIEGCPASSRCHGGGAMGSSLAPALTREGAGPVISDLYDDRMP